MGEHEEPQAEGRRQAAARQPAIGRRPHVEVDFHGERRSNAIHASTSDPDARLYRKRHGREAKLSYLGHVLMESHGGRGVGVR